MNITTPKYDDLWTQVHKSPHRNKREKILASAVGLALLQMGLGNA